MQFNPFLKPWEATEPNNVAGKGTVETPGQAENIIWQNRAAEPTAYETALGDALEKVFEDGASSLEEIVAGLNAQHFHNADGSIWTVESFSAEIARLGY